MGGLIRCVDRWGREIVLTEERWRNHVLPDHSELTGAESCVEMALTDPQTVRFDAVRANHEVFYRPNTLPPPYDHLFLKVCVEFHPGPPGHSITGEVITAFPTGRFRPGEGHKWP